jgi:hypothetical protein
MVVLQFKPRTSTFQLLAWGTLPAPTRHSHVTTGLHSGNTRPSHWEKPGETRRNPEKPGETRGNPGTENPEETRGKPGDGASISVGSPCHLPVRCR